MSEEWNSDIRYAEIQPKLKIAGGEVGKVKIDPMVSSIMIGYKF